MLNVYSTQFDLGPKTVLVFYFLLFQKNLLSNWWRVQQMLKPGKVSKGLEQQLVNVLVFLNLLLSKCTIFFFFFFHFGKQNISPLPQTLDIGSNSLFIAVQKRNIFAGFCIPWQTGLGFLGWSVFDRVVENAREQLSTMFHVEPQDKPI